jgi:hypothetical protein
MKVLKNLIVSERTLAVAAVDGRLADVARVDRDDVGHLGQRLERLA